MGDSAVPPGIGPCVSGSVEDLMRRFRIICRNCGSENVAVNLEEFYEYSELTSGGGTIQIGCNECKKNDFYTSL